MRRLVWPVAGLVVVVVGVVWAVLAGAPGADDFGFIAYVPGAPVPLEVDGNVVLVTRARIDGLVIAAAGVVVLAVWVGFRLGRRRAR